MSARVFAALLVLAGCLAVGATQAAPDPQRLLLYNLLGLDQRELFPGQDFTPLTELNAWTDLYESLRDTSRNDATEDRRHLKSFIFMGWVARARNDFATIEAFNRDFIALFEVKPEETLRVLADAEFLLPEMCGFLAKSFFFESGDPGARESFIARHRARMADILIGDRNGRCLDAFWRVER